MFNLGCENNFNGFRFFVLENFPFIEKDFDALSDYQIICKIFEYFNKRIEEIDGKYTNFQEQIDELRNELEGLENKILIELEEFETDINNSVDNKIAQNYSRVIQLLNEYQIIFDGKIQDLKVYLEGEIERVELGDVKAYNPTNGEIENVSKVIMDVYEILRQNAINCSEFDGLELTATEFDAVQITAYDFDINGKQLLNL